MDTGNANLVETLLAFSTAIQRMKPASSSVRLKLATNSSATIAPRTREPMDGISVPNQMATMSFVQSIVLTLSTMTFPKRQIRDAQNARAKPAVPAQFATGTNSILKKVQEAGTDAQKIMSFAPSTVLKQLNMTF